MRWLTLVVWLCLGAVGLIRLSAGWMAVAGLTAVSLGYVGLNLWFDWRQGRLITVRVLEEYLAVGILGIALLGFLLYY